MSRARTSIQKEITRIIPEKSLLLIAVSGGADSMALLHACLVEKTKLNLEISVAHVDHQLRETSKRDALFVKDYCDKNKLTFHLKTLDPSSLSENTENWARKERYSFFAELLEKYSLDWILTAHTASDVSETLLMRLISNKEPRSILRIDPRRKLIRPLLNITHEQIEEYIKLNNLNFYHDETNDQVTFLRNRVRHEIIPILKEKFDPKIDEVLSLRATNIAEDIETLYEIAKQKLIPCAEFLWGSKDWLKTFNSSAEASHLGIAWRMTELSVYDLVGFNIGRDKAAELLLVYKAEQQGLEIASGIRIKRKAGGVVLEK